MSDECPLHTAAQPSVAYADQTRPRETPTLCLFAWNKVFLRNSSPGFGVAVPRESMGTSWSRQLRKVFVVCMVM